MPFRIIFTLRDQTTKVHDVFATDMSNALWIVKNVYLIDEVIKTEVIEIP